MFIFTNCNISVHLNGSGNRQFLIQLDLLKKKKTSFFSNYLLTYLILIAMPMYNERVFCFVSVFALEQLGSSIISCFQWRTDISAAVIRQHNTKQAVHIEMTNEKRYLLESQLNLQAFIFNFL